MEKSIEIGTASADAVFFHVHDDDGGVTAQSVRQTAARQAALEASPVGVSRSSNSHGVERSTFVRRVPMPAFLRANTALRSLPESDKVVNLLRDEANTGDANRPAAIDQLLSSDELFGELTSRGV